MDDNYLVYPEYRGNGVLASQGNITENPHIDMIFVDFFASTVGLHVNGKAKIVEHKDMMKFKKNLPLDVLEEINSEGKSRPERWIMVEIEEAYIHCSNHIRHLKKMYKDIASDTDDDGIKRSDFFKLDDIPLYQRIGGEPAIQAITEAVVRKLLLDDTLKPVLDQISLQTLLDRQKHFLKTAFGAYSDKQGIPENLREYFIQQTHPKLDYKQMETAIGHLKKILVEMDVPDHEITKIVSLLNIRYKP